LSIKEVRQYDKGHFTVTQQYTEGGQTFSAEAKGVVQGLSKQVKPGDEMTVSISLSAPGGSGPRGNKIWGRAIVVYGKLAWTPWAKSSTLTALADKPLSR
jgi:hypothetical protein